MDIIGGDDGMANAWGDLCTYYLGTQPVDFSCLSSFFFCFCRGPCYDTHGGGRGREGGKREKKINQFMQSLGCHRCIREMTFLSPYFLFADSSYNTYITYNVWPACGPLLSFCVKLTLCRFVFLRQ